jgi:hypothetical protein
MDGGAAAGSAPHVSFGVRPISNVTDPASISSSCVNQGRSRPVSPSAADWTYFATVEAPGAFMTISLPPAGRMRACSNNGLPVT